MNKEIREQLKGYELTEEILDERFKNRPRFKTSFEGGVQLLYDSLYYYEPAMMYIEDYRLYELIDWIKTLLGTGANIHHPILHHINKEKAVKVIKEIIEIIKEKEEKSKICKEPEKENMKNEKKCNCGKDCKCKKEKSNVEKLFEKYPELKEPIKQKATLKLADGREIEVEISEDELKKIEVKKSPYDIITSENCTIYTVNDKNRVYSWQALGYQANDEYLKDVFDAVNSYNDKDFAEKCARADLLMRRLRKFAVENRIFNRPGSMYQIFFDDYDKIPYSSPCADINTGNILFTSEAGCQKAIETFHDELIWYFTEYLKIYE